MNYPHNIESKIGFDALRSIIENYCSSELGKNYVDAMIFSHEYTTIKSALYETIEMKNLLQEFDSFPIPSFVHIAPILSHLKTEGSYIAIEHISKLVKSLQDIKSLTSFLVNLKETHPYLYAKSHTISIPKEVIENCVSILSTTGGIKDNASKELADIRKKIQTKKQTLHSKIAQILKIAKNEGWSESNTETSIRNGRFVIPVHSSQKRKLKGIVHDESATGKTSYIEPSETFELHNEIANLEFKEQREILKILHKLTSIIRPHIPEIETAYIFLGFIDFLIAKTKLAIRLNAEMPKLEKNPGIDLYGARHPLLQISYEHTQKTVVPLRILLDSKQRIIVISGPNAGGKSVCMKTVVLLQYMIQCGLLIPCDAHSTIGIFKQIFVDIGDEQSLENDLSTYSSHLKTMKHMLLNSNDRTCVFIDEFGTGTEPLLGGAIAESMLDFFAKNDVYGIITTHYTNLKHAAKSLKNCINGAMLFDSEHMNPLFKLRMGQPGSSFAFEIAKNIGIPHEIIETAEQKIGIEHVNFDEHLKKIESEKQYVFKQKQRLEQKIIDLDKKKEEYSHKLNDISKKKQELIEETKQILNSHISEANKILETTIRAIKEQQADKDKTKELRKKLKEKQDSLKQSIEHFEKKNNHTSPISKVKTPQFKIGSFVVLKGQTVVGEILNISKKQAHVQFGNVQSFVPLEKLELSTKKPDKLKPTAIHYTKQHMREKHTNFSTKIDVRGMRAEEALYAIQDFIETGYTMGIKHLEILHGKGYGILREQIRNYLQTVHFIESFKDAPIDMGGDGITIVKIQ